MKKTVFLLAVLILNYLLLNGQETFDKFYGGDEEIQVFFVEQTNDEGYIISGKKGDYGDFYRINLLKTDLSGDTLWTNEYFLGEMNSFQDDNVVVHQVADGGYIVAGCVNTSDSYDYLLLKTDANGDSVWVKTYGFSGYNEYLTSSIKTNDGGLLLAGWTESLLGYDKIYIVKTNDTGDTLWTNIIGKYFNRPFVSVQQTSDNGYILTGNTEQYYATLDFQILLVRTDSNGDTLWTKHYGGDKREYVYAVEQTDDGGYIIAGASNSYGSSPPNAYVVKTNSIGDTVWTRTYNSVGYYIRNIVQTDDGGYVILTSDEFFKINSTGEILWVHNSNCTVTYSSLRKTIDNGFVAVANNGGPKSDPIYLVKTNESGEGCFFCDTYQEEKICIVGVDMITGKNKIIWEKTQNKGISGYNIYREQKIGGYEKIGYKPFDSLSVFIDSTSEPEQRKHRYKISSLVECGEESLLSPYHSPLFLQFVNGQLEWQPYEGGSFNFDYYIIYRGSDSIVLTEYDTVPETQTVYNDIDPAAQTNKFYYRIGGVLHTPCDPANLLKCQSLTKASSGPFSQAISNLEDNRLKEQAIPELGNNRNNINIYPNPASDNINITVNLPNTGQLKVSLHDIMGREQDVLYDNKISAGTHAIEYQVDKLTPGVYMLRFEGDGSVYTERVVVE